MNKAELVDAIAADTKCTKKDAEAFIKSFTATVSRTLAKGEDLQLIGFGTFCVSERAARTGRNPKTGQDITIPAAKMPKFKPGKALKDSVN